MKEEPDISFALTHDQALVLFDWLCEHNIETPIIEGVLLKIEAALEKQLVEPLQPNYKTLVAEAKKRLAEG